MTNERYLAILAIILASVVLISSSLTVDASDSIEKDNGCSTVGNVTLFSNDSVNIKKITDEINELNIDTESPNYKKIAIIDKSWLSNNSQSTIDTTVMENIESGKIVLLFGDEDPLSSSNISFSAYTSIEGVVARGLYVDSSGIGHSYKVVTQNQSYARELTYEWVNSIQNISNEETSNLNSYTNTVTRNDDSPTGWVVMCYETIAVDIPGRGTSTLGMCISKMINHMDEDKDIFSVHYNFNGTPDVDEGYRLGDLDMEFILSSGVLHKAEPQSTAGTSSSSVSVNFGSDFGNDNLSGGVGVSFAWEYSINDVVITNEIVEPLERVKIDHDINEDKNVGKGYTAEPGLLVYKDVDEGWIEIMTHCTVVTYEKRTILGIIDQYINQQSMWYGVQVSISNSNAYAQQFGIY